MNQTIGLLDDMPDDEVARIHTQLHRCYFAHSPDDPRERAFRRRLEARRAQPD